jgi:hypothetical protein
MRRFGKKLKSTLLTWPETVLEKFENEIFSMDKSFYFLMQF